MTDTITTVACESKSLLLDSQEFGVVAQEIQWFMIDGMTIDDHVRARIGELVDARETTQTDLGKRLGISQQAVKQYIDGLTKRWPHERIVAAERILGRRLRPEEPPGPATKSTAGQQPQDPVQSYVDLPLRLIPAVDIRRYPREVPRERRMAELKIRQYGVRETRSPDPEAHYIRIDEKVGRRGEPGDEALISPATPPLDGEFVAIECEMGVRVGRYTDLGDRRYVELTASGHRISEFTVIGTVLRLSIPPQ